MPEKNDDDFFDDAAAFWQWINDRRNADDNEQPFLSGQDDEENQGDFDFDPDDFGDLSDILLSSHDEIYVTDHELASTAYTVNEISDAIAYCRDAPPGILRMWVTEEGEIEIYRFPS